MTNENIERPVDKANICSFAFDLGKTLGALHNEKTVKHLRDKGVPLHVIQESRSNLMVIAEIFYEGKEEG